MAVVQAEEVLVGVELLHVALAPAPDAARLEPPVLRAREDDLALMLDQGPDGVPVAISTLDAQGLDRVRLLRRQPERRRLLHRLGRTHHEARLGQARRLLGLAPCHVEFARLGFERVAAEVVVLLLHLAEAGVGNAQVAEAPAFAEWVADLAGDGGEGSPPSAAGLAAFDKTMALAKTLPKACS